MSAVQMTGLTKDFGDFRAVDDVTFSVERGDVVGFLGPNGSGKTTTLRMAVGHVAPTAGEALIDGQPYRELTEPLRVVGASLEAEARAMHPRRRGRDHLRIIARQGQLAPARVDEVLDMLGLTAAADRAVSTYSLGMRQRLALAAALLGDPDVLLLDEPANGLDPEGITWLRNLLRRLAAQGRAVLVSSHSLPEIARTVDRVVVIGHGRMLADGTIDEITAEHGEHAVRVRTSDDALLAGALEGRGMTVTRDREAGGDVLRVRGQDARAVSTAARELDLDILELAQEGTSLEETYLRLTADVEEIR